MIWWFFLFYTASVASRVFQDLLYVAAILLSLYIVNRRMKMYIKMSWIFLILSVPIVGIPCYFFFGRPELTSKTQKRMARIVEAYAPLRPENELLNETLRQTDMDAYRQSRLITQNQKYPLYAEDCTEYFKSGEEAFESILKDLRSAEKFIFMEYFIVTEGVMWDSIKAILKEKAAAGVEVRFAYDDLGSVGCLPKNFRKELAAAGIHVLTFNPFRPALSAVMNNRNHRKITVIDGYIAYTGGFNLADEYINQKQRFGHWKDTGLRLYGEGVYSLTLMCLELWNAFYNTNDNCKKYLPHRYHPEPFPTDGYVQPYCNSPFENETLAQDIYLDLLYQAKEYVYIFTPYLAIDDEMQHALCMAAQRGVDVRLVTPGIPDKRVVYSLTRSYYEPLIRAGVRIYEYTPGFIHAKSYLVDDRIGIVGTINMDYRSLYLHMECAAMLVECSALQKMKLDCVVTIEKSRRVTLQDCKRRRHSLLWQAILRTISPLL